MEFGIWNNPGKTEEYEILFAKETSRYVLEREWQNRPLEKSYPILFLDSLRVNSRQDGKNVNKALYVALAINWEGRKEVLSLWLADTEGAKFWTRSPRERTVK